MWLVWPLTSALSSHMNNDSCLLFKESRPLLGTGNREERVTAGQRETEQSREGGGEWSRQTECPPVVDLFWHGCETNCTETRCSNIIKTVCSVPWPGGLAGPGPWAPGPEGTAELGPLRPPPCGVRRPRLALPLSNIVWNFHFDTSHRTGNPTVE